jgi:positive regulator of sigma E activity
MSLILGLLFFGGAFFVVKSRSNQMAQKEAYQPEVLRILSMASRQE